MKFQGCVSLTPSPNGLTVTTDCVWGLQTDCSYERLISWPGPFTWRWKSQFFQRDGIRNFTVEKLYIWQNNTCIKKIENRWSTTAGQIVRETTNCYVHSHLLWSKIRLHYLTFPSHCFLMWGRHFVAWAFPFVVPWRNLANTVKNKLLLFLLDMTLTFVWLIIASNDLINLFVCTFQPL